VVRIMDWMDVNTHKQASIRGRVSMSCAVAWDRSRQYWVCVTFRNRGNCARGDLWGATMELSGRLRSAVFARELPLQADSELQRRDRGVDEALNVVGMLSSLLVFYNG
jgi:hypothetical protein